MARRKLPGRVAAVRKPLQSDPSPEISAYRSSSEFEIFDTGSVFVPLVHEGTLFGVMGVAKGFHHEYAPDEIAFLTSIGHLIAAYLK